MSLTIKQQNYSEGYIYKDLKIKTKFKIGTKVINSIIVILAIIPMVLAFYLGPIYLLAYIASAIFTVLLITLGLDLGLDKQIEVFNNTGEARFKDEISKGVAITLVDISNYQTELASIVKPETLYDEVFTKLNRYQELVDIQKSKEAEKDLKIYHTNLLKLLKNCQERRETHLLTTDEILNSALENCGENPERK